METSPKYSAGLERMAAINGADVEAVKARLAANHPDLARYIVEFAYGEVHCREGLDVKSRQLATVVSLATLGYPKKELRIHLHNALNVGWSEAELCESILHLAVYCGFPTANSAMEIALKVFDERRSGLVSAKE